MPTQSTTYNTRLTDEALEKRFRDTFRSQGGAELVDDLYASGVIIPVVDFTAAAEGSSLRNDLQRAWDSATNLVQVTSTTATDVVTTPGFYKVTLNYAGVLARTQADRLNAAVSIKTGAVLNPIWQFSNAVNVSLEFDGVVADEFVVFLRSNDSLVASTQGTNNTMNIWTRQIADVYGNFTNPSGFTSQ